VLVGLHWRENAVADEAFTFAADDSEHLTDDFDLRLFH
jgi:hypothetical protein